VRRRRRFALAAAAAGLLLAADLARPPARQVTARGAVAAIGLYQRTLSPRLPALGVRCRFVPTCSRYAVAALRRDGFAVGSARALWRVARCGPWTPRGTFDPP
jgi:putative membrane protein insertion efficiency factor